MAPVRVPVILPKAVTMTDADGFSVKSADYSVNDDLRPGDPSASGPTGEAIAGGVAPACGTPDPQIRSLALYSGDVLDHCMRKCAHTEQ